MNKYGQLQGKTLIWERNDAKYPWITIGRDLKFGKHVQKLYKKSSQNLSALSIRKEQSLKFLSSLKLNITRFFGSIIVNVPTKN